jgi:outer membrane receptor protein involved in Fe transport
MRPTSTTLFFALLLALPALLLGQGDLGGIRGVVLDATGSVIPDANVTATNVGTGVATRTVTTGAGVYSMPNLRAGVYRVEVEKPGFKKALRENVSIPVGVVLGMDLPLEVGETTQTVEVTAAAPLLQSENVTLATSVNPKSYLDLPISAGGSRSVESFINLAPGVAGSSSFDFNANGGQLFSRQVKIDGLDIGNVLAQPGDTSKVLTFPPDALQEFTYNTSNQSADQGNNQSGSILYTVRSGTNNLHGSAYEFNTGNYLSARNFFQSTVPRFNRNEYGATIGGPIYIPKVYNGKNRSFFFFNFNRFSVRSAPSQSFVTVPTAQQHTGNFSDYTDGRGAMIPIYDPATTTALAGGGFTRNVFPGNIIPTARISPISAKIAAGIPNPLAGTGIANNFFQRTVSRQGFTNETFKIDHLLTDRQRFSFTFNNHDNHQYSCSNPCFDPSKTTGPDVVAGVQNSSFFDAKHWFGHLNYDLTITPRNLFHFTGGIDRYYQCSDAESWGQGWEQVLGFKNLGGGRFPAITFAGFYQSLSANQSNECYYGTVPQGNWNFTMIRGKHSIKFGGEHSWYTNSHSSPDFPAMYFTPLETALPGSSQTGNPFASFLLGATNQGVRHVQDHTTHAFYWYQAFYVQDDIKWTKDLTINLGLRYELFAPYYDKNDYLSTMDPSVPNPGCGGCLGAMIFAGNGPGRAGKRRLAPPIVKNNFSPRIGIAYSPKQNLVVRAGYAITDVMPAVAGSGGVRWSNLGFAADATFQSLNNGVTPGFFWDNGFPQFQAPPFIDPSFALNSTVVTYDRNATHPAYMQQWNFNIQSNFKPNWLFDIGYVGSKGTRLYSGTMNINQTDSKFLSLGPLLSSSIDDPAVRARGFGRPYSSFTGSLSQALRPFPQYLYVGSGGNEIRLLQLGGAQNGSSSYHSLQAKIQHNFSQGLWLLASYTWQKWLTNAPTTAGGGFGTISTQGGFAGVSARDHYHRNIERALGPIPPQMFTVGFNYELPLGPGKAVGRDTKGVAAALLKGWQINGILRYYAGTPLTVFVNNTLPIFNDINFPNIMSGVPQIQTYDITVPRGPGQQLYLNPAAFQEPAPFTYGNAPQTLDIRGFANLNENLSIMKRTYFTETANLELRFETFNTFNRHRWTGIAANLSAPGFGTITSVSGGRTAQIGGKIVF